MRELEAIEAAYPELVTPDSPTQRVGAPPLERQFAPVQHASRMYSLDNAMDLDELDAWLERVARALGDRRCEFVCELKIDGSSLALTYEDGVLVRAATRGDGTHRRGRHRQRPHDRDVPLRLARGARRPQRDRLRRQPSSGAEDATQRAAAWYLEVRGEVYMPKASFERLNAEQDEAGAPPFANPRNAAAGSRAPEGPGDHRVARSRDVHVRRSPIRARSASRARARCSRGCARRASA